MTSEASTALVTSFRDLVGEPISCSNATPFKSIVIRSSTKGNEYAQEKPKVLTPLHLPPVSPNEPLAPCSPMSQPKTEVSISSVHGNSSSDIQLSKSKIGSAGANRSQLRCANTSTSFTSLTPRSGGGRRTANSRPVSSKPPITKSTSAGVNALATNESEKAALSPKSCHAQVSHAKKLSRPEALTNRKSTLYKASKSMATGSPPPLDEINLVNGGLSSDETDGPIMRSRQSHTDVPVSDDDESDPTLPSLRSSSNISSTPSLLNVEVLGNEEEFLNRNSAATRSTMIVEALKGESVKKKEKLPAAGTARKSHRDSTIAKASPEVSPDNKNTRIGASGALSPRLAHKSVLHPIRTPSEKEENNRSSPPDAIESVASARSSRPLLNLVMNKKKEDRRQGSSSSATLVTAAATPTQPTSPLKASSETPVLTPRRGSLVTSPRRATEVEVNRYLLQAVLNTAAQKARAESSSLQGTSTSSPSCSADGRPKTGGGRTRGGVAETVTNGGGPKSTCESTLASPKRAPSQATAVPNRISPEIYVSMNQQSNTAGLSNRQIHTVGLGVGREVAMDTSVGRPAGFAQRSQEIIDEGVKVDGGRQQQQQSKGMNESVKYGKKAVIETKRKIKTTDTERLENLEASLLAAARADQLKGRAVTLTNSYLASRVPLVPFSAALSSSNVIRAFATCTPTEQGDILMIGGQSSASTAQARLQLSSSFCENDTILISRQAQGDSEQLVYQCVSGVSLPVAGHTTVKVMGGGGPERTEYFCIYGGIGRNLRPSLFSSTHMLRLNSSTKSECFILETAAPQPPGRARHVAVAICEGNVMLIHGGHCHQTPSKILGDIWQLDLRGDRGVQKGDSDKNAFPATWQKLPQAVAPEISSRQKGPVARFGHHAAVRNNYLFIAFGQCAHRLLENDIPNPSSDLQTCGLDDIWAFNLNTYFWYPIIPSNSKQDSGVSNSAPYRTITGRSSCASTVIDKTRWIFHGGFDFERNTVVNSIYEFNLETLIGRNLKIEVYQLDTPRKIMPGFIAHNIACLPFEMKCPTQGMRTSFLVLGGVNGAQSSVKRRALCANGVAYIVWDVPEQEEEVASKAKVDNVVEMHRARAAAEAGRVDNNPLMVLEDDSSHDSCAAPEGPDRARAFKSQTEVDNTGPSLTSLLAAAESLNAQLAKDLTALREENLKLKAQLWVEQGSGDPDIAQIFQACRRLIAKVKANP